MHPKKNKFSPISIKYKYVVIGLLTYCLSLFSYTYAEILHNKKDITYEKKIVNGELQLIDASLINSNEKDSYVILITSDEYEVNDDIHYSEKLYQWIASDNDTELYKYMLDELYVLHNKKVIFSSVGFEYEHIAFLDVCTNNDGRQQLLFDLGKLGSGNGYVDDKFFLLYDKHIKKYKTHIITTRFIADSCSLKKALIEKEKENQINLQFSHIFDQLVATKNKTDITEHKLLKIKQFNNEVVSPVLKKILKLQTSLVLRKKNIQMKNKKYVLFPTIVLSELANTKKWQLFNIAYNIHAESYGMLLVKNKKTNQWFSFFNTPTGLSHTQLYTPENLTINDDILTGYFCYHCMRGGSWKTYKINLVNFKISEVKKLP
jgi:hypothetical protein